MSVTFIDDAPTTPAKTGGVTFIDEPIGIKESIVNASTSSIPVESDEQLTKDFDQNKDEWTTIGKTRFDEGRLEWFKNNPIGGDEVSDFLQNKQVVPGGGLAQGGEAIKMALIANNISKGEDVPQSQIDSLNDYTDRMVEMNLRGFSTWGKVGYYGMQVPAFMGEMGATFGFGKSAQVIATRATSKVVKNILLKKAIGTTANVTARTTAMVPLSVSTYGSRRINDAMSITDKGEVLLQESKESPTKSVLMSYGSTYITVASEMMGGTLVKGLGKITSPITKPIGAVVNKYLNPAGKLKTPMITALNKFPVSLQKAFYQSAKKANVLTKASVAMSRAGYSSIAGEMLEEEAENVGQAGFGLATGDINKEQALDMIRGNMSDRVATGIIVVGMGGVNVSANALSASGGVVKSIFMKNGNTEKEANELINNMTETEKENMVQEQYPDPKSGYITEDIPINITGDIIEPFDFEERATIQFQDIQNKADDITRIRTTVENIKNDVPVEFEELEEIKSLVSSIDVDKEKRPEDFIQAVRRVGGIHLRTAKAVDLHEISGLKDTIAFKGLLTKKGIREHSLVELVKEFTGRDVDSVEAFEFFAEAFDTPQFRAEDVDIAKEIEELDNNISFLETELGIDLLTIKQDILRADAFTSVPEEFKHISNIQSDLSKIEVESQEQIDPPLVLDEESGFNNGFQDFKEKTKEVKDWFIFEMVNDKRFLESLSPDIKQSIRQFHGIAGTIRQNLQVGIYETIDGQTQIVGKSLKSITDDWHNSIMEVEPSLDTRLNDQNDYLQARRMIEDLIPRADVDITETQQAKALVDMARLNDKYGDKIEWFEEFSNELYENQQQILHKLVDAGVLSEESFKAITEANPHYISFNRVIEDGQFTGYSKKPKFTGAKADIKKIKGGSDLEIDNFLRTISINTGKMIAIAERNKIATSVKDVLVGLGQAEKSKPLLKETEEDGKKVLKPSRQKPEGTMSVYENGERVFYNVEEKVLREIDSRDPNENDFIAKLLAPLKISAKVLRAGATGLNPEFWSRNFIRDTLMVNLQSKVNPNAKDAVQGVFSILGHKKIYDDWEALGGSFDSYMGQTAKDMDKNLEEIYKELYGKDSKLQR